MATWTPDPTFYPSPKMAMTAPRETLAYVAVIDPERRRPDALAVLDLDPQSAAYGQVVGRLDLPYAGDELHHFGWNACSAALCPTMPHPHLERRYLLIPGLRSSRVYVVATTPSTAAPTRSTSMRSARPMAMGRAASSYSTTPASRSRARGRRTAGHNSWPTISGGTWAATP